MEPVRIEGVPEPPVPMVQVREVGLGRIGQPLCPKCHRPVAWKEEACPYCGHLFDTQDAVDHDGWQPRRDALAHRGELIDRLGGLALLAGAFVLCTGLLGALVALACGIPAWWMAQRDLAGMAVGSIDPSGQLATEYGPNKAVAGMVLSLLSSVFWILALIELSH